MKSLEPTEHQTQNAIIQYLRRKGYYVQRMNSGAMRATGATGKQYLMRLNAAGTPDVMAFKKWSYQYGVSQLTKAELLFIEVKRKGKKLTFMQTIKMKELEDFGAQCFVATSVKDLIDRGI